jgi:hypothetical protein
VTGPWSESDVHRARGVPLLKVLSYVCDYLKEDQDYTPSDPSVGRRRFHVNCSKRDFRLLLSGEKWLDELVSRDAVNRGGGGAVDLVMYLKDINFVQAVKVCLDAAESVRT